MPKQPTEQPVYEGSGAPPDDRSGDPPEGIAHLDHRALPLPERLRSTPELVELTTSLREAVGDELRAILLFGSRLAGTSPDRHSAYDLVVVVGDYTGAYRNLRAAGYLHRAPRLMALLAHILPPNNISYRVRPESPALAKCMVLTEAHFRGALSEGARDHFCLGRMLHQVALVHARDARVRDRVLEIVDRGRRTALSWVTPFVPEPFTVEDFTRRMIEVSFAGEIRPESDDRPEEVTLRQMGFLATLYGEILEEAVRGGVLLREGEGYRLARTPGRLARARWALYFRWSNARATARWFKHMITFQEWMDYIARKVERRMGLVLEPTPLERKYPLIFLWPKLFKVLAARRRPKNTPSGDAPDED